MEAEGGNPTGVFPDAQASEAGILTRVPWNESILILPLRPEGEDEKEAHTRLFNKRKKWVYKENFQLKCCL